MSGSISPLFEDASPLSLAKGDALFRAGDAVRSMFLVASGQAVLARHTEAGSRIVQQRALAGDVLAEASVYSDRYHCDATAGEPTVVLAVPASRFRHRVSTDAKLATAWAAHLARTVQRARLRAEIRTLRTVARRLDVWLEELGPLPPKGQWQELAGELGVSREALYRELAARRGERTY